MTNGNGSKFYFKVEDLKALLDSGAKHIVVNAETGQPATMEGFDAAAAPKGTKGGCPWPCGGTSGTAINQQNLEQARQTIGGGASSYKPQ